jgi:anti-sigma factor RsiW
MNCHEAARLLDPYVDDELSSDESASLAGHVEACASCRHQLEERQALRHMIRGLPYYRAPDRLRSTVVAGRQPIRLKAPVFQWAAAAVVVAALASALLVRTWWTAHTTSAIAETVVARHVKALASQPLVDVRSSDQHTVKPWFQGKLDFSPPVPDLSRAGFPLIGGRVDSIDGRTVAALVYQRRLHVIHVFIWPAIERASSTDTRAIRGFHERHWVQDEMSVWAVSDVNDADLNEFARAFAGM